MSTAVIFLERWVVMLRNIVQIYVLYTWLQLSANFFLIDVQEFGKVDFSLGVKRSMDAFIHDRHETMNH